VDPGPPGAGLSPLLAPVEVVLLPFRSILFNQPEDVRDIDERQAPDFFADLNLDQIVDSITRARDGYNLKPFFYASLRSADEITYRHQVMQDLQGEALLACLRSFAERMRTMHEQLAVAGKLHYRYQREAWFLEAVESYGESVATLADELTGVEIDSAALKGFRDYLTDYVASTGFTALRAETKTLTDELAEIRYNLHLKGDRIRVTRYDGEPDYSAEVEATFEKFKLGAAKDYRIGFPRWDDMNHVEAAVLDMVARLYPDTFRKLDEYCVRHDKYIDKVIARFDREVQFYVAYLEYMVRITRKGLEFCFPTVSDRSKEIRARDTFDLALADNLVAEKKPVVCNDFYLKDAERIFVVSGPNQGGKTTFARTFGQLHHLASLGLPVPGREARLFLFDRLFTHFEKEEDATNLRGKLEDDLTRIHDILTRATPRSIVIMNEAFTSTTLDDAVFLGEKILGRLIELDVMGVCVTFADELSQLGPATVSMVSTVNPNDPAVRTYKVVRRPADGLAYAATIARKYRLTYERLKERITS
jgi:DNA mismatch repair protein MutS